ncbi:MAG TPA: 16S rRNA (cytosine(1402)-N(4))-methyltransferase RsmH [Bacteroidetes bacterium]|nr:16S rRNA (cytosine(1402)-N(4))-methyltransferase RsmH [Bacteroidota bacterium]
MVQEVIDWLVTNPDGIYIDATLGGGGHTTALLQKLGVNARVIGIDRDTEAIDAASRRLAGEQRFSAVHGRFSEISSLADRLAVGPCDGIFADLGVSSHQIDTAGRGFSFMQDGPLDLRMNPAEGRPASELVMSLPADELASIFYRFGEERYSRRIAGKIVEERRKRELRSTAALVQVIEMVTPHKQRIKTLARIFQALRIAVNDELGELERFLAEGFQLLKPFGRMVLLTYHSLEDRIVKHFFVDKARACICPPEAPVCVCNHHPEARILTRRPVCAGAEEVARNPRARSAKLRAAEKIAETEIR